MAAVNDQVLLAYGGFYEPGIESMGSKAPITQVPGGVLYNTENSSTVKLTDQPFTLTSYCAGQAAWNHVIYSLCMVGDCMTMVKFNPTNKSLTSIFNFEVGRIMLKIQEMEQFDYGPEPKDDGVPRERRQK